MTRTIVFVESNTTGTGELFVRRSLELGLAPTVVAADHGRYPFEAIEGVTTVVADTADHDALAEVVSARSPAAVTSTSDYFVGTAARIAERLGLPSLGWEAVERCRDKTAQREALDAAGVAVPRFEAARSLDDAVAAGRRLGWPVVCKPAVGSGSVGVRSCVDEAQLRAHAGPLLAAAVNERGTAIKPEVLVEQLIGGDEYSIEIVGASVQAVVRKRLGAMPHFVEIGHDYPASPDPATLSVLREVAIDAVRALGVTHGPCHVEARIAEGAVWIIEVNPRLAGGRIPILVARCGGPDLVAATIATALGEPVAEPPEPVLRGALRFVVAGGAAMAGDVAPELVGDHGSWEAQMYVAPRTRVRRHNDFRDRVGHAMACSRSASEARRAAREHAARLAETLAPLVPAPVGEAA